MDAFIHVQHICKLAENVKSVGTVYLESSLQLSFDYVFVYNSLPIQCRPSNVETNYLIGSFFRRIPHVNQFSCFANQDDCHFVGQCFVSIWGNSGVFEPVSCVIILVRRKIHPNPQGEASSERKAPGLRLTTLIAKLDAHFSPSGFFAGFRLRERLRRCWKSVAGGNDVFWFPDNRTL